MHIVNYDGIYLEEILSMIKESIQKINCDDYSEKQIKTWSTIDKASFEGSIPLYSKVMLSEKNAVIGYGDMTSNGYLDRLFVHKDWQRKDIATKLLNSLENSSNVTTFETYASITAKPFFEKQHYYVVKENIATLKGVNFINYYMKKELAKK